MLARIKINKQALIVLIVVIFIISYAFFEAHLLVQGPQISITLPKQILQDDALVTIQGKTSNITWLALLGKPIHVNEQGVFREELLVPVGYSVFTIEARDRFGRSTTEKIEIVRKPPLFPLQTLTTASSSLTTPS